MAGTCEYGNELAYRHRIVAQPVLKGAVCQRVGPGPLGVGEIRSADRKYYFWLFITRKRAKILYYIHINLLKPTGHYMYHQFNIQQLYALPTLYLCVLYLSENKQRLVPLTA